MCGLISHELHSGMTRAMTKKGSQHTTKAPVMMASVLAAFRSRFASRDSFFSLRAAAAAAAEVAAADTAAGDGLLSSATSPATEPLFAVGDLSGEVFAPLIVNAVVDCGSELLPSVERRRSSWPLLYAHAPALSSMTVVVEWPSTSTSDDVRFSPAPAAAFSPSDDGHLSRRRNRFRKRMPPPRPVDDVDRSLSFSNAHTNKLAEANLTIDTPPWHAYLSTRRRILNKHEANRCMNILRKLQGYLWIYAEIWHEIYKISIKTNPTHWKMSTN